jgi:hypothetical protein
MAQKLQIESTTMTCRPSLLVDLETRQEDVLRQLDDLNRRIEQAVSEGRLQTGSAQVDKPTPPSSH